MPYFLPPPSITIWHRLEARPRSDSLGPSLSAQVRDPAWFLARQWQVGELSGQDAGSPAFVSIRTVTGNMELVSTGATTRPYDGGAPLEKQALAEPFSPDDLTLQVEVGHVLGDLLDAKFGAGSEPATRIRGQFLTALPVKQPATTLFDPLDDPTKRFLTLCAGKAIDGSEVYKRAKANDLPPGIGNPGEQADIAEVLGKLIAWVDAVWGGIGTTDPEAWRPRELRYEASVQAASPAGGRVVMSVTPDSAGETPWSSFDVTGTASAATEAIIDTKVLVPGMVRFPGMPSWRFWDFESGAVSLPDIHPDPQDLTKLLALDFMIVHGQDWFLVPVAQPVGTVARVEALIVTDVFGRQTSLDRADAGSTAPGLSRWSAFSHTKVPSPTQAAGLADFFLTAPSFGSALQSSRVLEEVRFARDEMANMAWAIERRVPNRLGEARSGRERGAAVDELVPATPPESIDVTSPLRYLVETPIPIEYVPLVGVLLQPTPVPPNPPNPAIILEKAANVRPLPAGGFDGVPAATKIMKPQGVGNAYQISEEEVLRLGTTVERVVIRSRWTDGSTHLWIQRRRRTGAGETQSGLRFDAANPIAR